MRFQASHWLACVLVCSAVLAAAAWRGPDSRPGRVLAAAQESSPLGQARAGIAAVYHPGPEYRAYSEADEEADRRSKEGSRYPKHGHSKPHPDEADDHKEGYGPYNPYPEPRPEYHSREEDPERHDSRHYSDKDDQHRGPHDDPSYSRDDSHDKPPYEKPEQHSAYEQPPYHEKQDSYYDNNKPSSYQQQPAYGEQHQQEQQDSYYKPYHPYEEDSSSRPAYGKDSYYDRDGPHDSYNRRGEEEYDAPYDPYGGEGSYGKPKSHICLQEQKRRTVPRNTDTDDQLTSKFSSTFQCCSRDDAPDACLAGNQTGSYDYYSSYPSFRSDSLLDTYLSPPSAATCNWQYTSSLCPPHLLETCLGAGKLSCTLSADAKSCGAPTRKLQFVAEGWFIGAEALSCEAFYGPSVNLAQAGRRRLATAPAAAGAEPGVTIKPQFIVDDGTSEGGASAEDDGLVSAVAWIFQGKIKLVKNRDGYQEARGTVRFVASFGQPPNGTQIRNGQNGSGRRLMAEEAPKAAATPAAAGSPAAPAAAAAASAKAATDSQAPAAAATPAAAKATADTKAPAAAAAPAAAKATDTKTPAASATPVAAVSDAKKAPAAAAPAAAQAGTPAPASVQGGYEPDYDSSYGDYGGSDLPIVKGGSLSITLYDSYYDDKDDYKY